MTKLRSSNTQETDQWTRDRLDRLIASTLKKGSVRPEDSSEIAEGVIKTSIAYWEEIRGYRKRIRKGEPIHEPLRGAFFCHRDSQSGMDLMLATGPQSEGGHPFNVSQGDFSGPGGEQALLFPITSFLKKGGLYDRAYSKDFHFRFEPEGYRGKNRITFLYGGKEGGKWFGAFDARYAPEDYIAFMTRSGLESFIGFIGGRNSWEHDLAKLNRVFVYDPTKGELDVTLGALLGTGKCKKFFREFGLSPTTLSRIDYARLHERFKLDDQGTYKFRGWH